MLIERKLWGVWLALWGVCFALMLTHESTNATLLGRYTSSYAFLLAITGLSGVLPLWGVYRKQARLPRLPAWGVLAMACMGVLVVTFTRPLGDFALGTGAFRLYACAVLMWGVWAVFRHENDGAGDVAPHAPPQTGSRDVGPLQAQDSVRQHPSAMPYYLVLGVGTALFVATVLALVGRSPTPLLFDEQFFAGWASEIWRTGRLDALDIFYFGETSSFLLFGLVPIGGWLSAFGVGLAQGRLGAFLLGALALPFAYALLKPHGRGWAWAGVLWMSVALFGQSYVRPDGWVALVVMVALWASQREGFGWHVLVGVALASALEGHILGVRVALAWGAVVGLGWLWRGLRGQGWRDARFWGLLAGGVGYALAYLLLRLVYYGLSLQDWLAMTAQSYALEANLTQSLSLTERALANVGALLLHYVRFAPLEGVIIAVASVLAWQKGGQVRFWTVILGLSGAILCLSNPKPHYTTFYGLHVLPLVVAMLAGVLAHTPPHKRSALAGVALLALVWAWAGVLDKARETREQEVIDVGYRVDALLPADVVGVVGDVPYYWGLGARQFTVQFVFPSEDVAGFYARRNEALPQVVMVTEGVTGNLLALNRFIAQEGFVRAFCLPIRALNRRVEVYVHPSVTVEEKDDCQP
mgnify:CR=1 FL=1